MALYGYPTITLKDKDTGKIKKEISCKNIQTIPARMMFSGRYSLTPGGSSGQGFFIGNYYDRSNPKTSFIFTLPYRMPKTPYFSRGPSFYGRSDNVPMADGQYVSSYTDVIGIDNIKIEQDSNGKDILVYRGVLYAPTSGIRKIGTICLGMNYSYSDLSHFYTPLDEIIDQDSATVIDITYKIIISGSTPREYAYNYLGFYRGISADTSGIVWAGNPGFTPELMRSVTPILGNSRTVEYNSNILYSGLYSGMDNSSYNSVYPEAADNSYSPKFKTYTGGIGSSGHRVHITRDSMRSSGIFIGSVGINTNRSLYPSDISKVSNKKGVSVTLSKRRDSLSLPVKPFFEASSIKRGDGTVKAVSATEKRGFPERWEIDVIKGGPLSAAEFRIRKTVVSGYEGNTNIAIPMFAEHLSFEGAIGSSIFPKYNHPDGRLYESSPAVWPLYGQNIAIVIRKGVLLTSVGNARYIILDETNLPHENRGIQITGIAWDDSKKGLLIGCGESGLYRVDFDNDTDNEPTVKRVTKDGVEHVYAISGNGKGHVAIVTDAGIMYSDNLGDTWNTKTFDTVKSQISGVDEYTDSNDYIQMFKHKIFCFLLSRDGGSIKFTDKYQYYRDGCLNIELASSEKATIGGRNSYNTYSSIIMGPNATNSFNFAPICLSQSVAEAEKTTIKELISTDKYAIQPNACLGLSADGKAPVVSPYDFISIANGSIKELKSIDISNETSNEVRGSGSRYIANDGSIISNGNKSPFSLIHNGRWGVGLRSTSTYKIRTYVVGAALHHSKDSPSLFGYYNQTNNTFEAGKTELVYKPTSGEVTVDGVKLEFSGNTFEVGDCFIFHRTMAYVDDNVSTMSMIMEKSAIKKSEWFEKTGTISEEMPKPIYRHPICIVSNMYKTQDNRLKTKDRTFTEINEIRNQSPQYRVSGSAKFKFDLSRLKGGFLVEILAGYRYSNGTDYNSRMHIYAVKNGQDILYHCMFKQRQDEVLLSGNDKLNTTNLYVTIDHEKRGVTVNDGDKVIWTSGSLYVDTNQTYDIRILPVSLCMKNGNPCIYNFGPRWSWEGITAINDEAEMFLPTFEYGYKGALCTELGDEATSTGIYDPVFYSTPGIITDDSMIIEIDGKPAEAKYFYSNSDSTDLTGVSSPLKPGSSSRGGVSANITSGQVRIDSYMGIVYFSDEDIGKPYKIRYKYYKGDSLGIGEAILE